MRRLSVVPLLFLATLAGCQRTATLTTRTFGSLDDPSGSTGDHLGYFVSQEQDGGRWSYGILTFGRKVELVAAPKQADMVADGKILTLPQSRTAPSGP